MDKNKCDLGVMCGFFRMPVDGEWSKSVTAYHVTHKSNVESILSKGLIAKPCHATVYGEARTPAVYLFAAKADTTDKNIRNFLFGDEQDDLVVIKVTIPYNSFDKIYHDGLFAMSCICDDSSYPSSIQFVDDIPAAWLTIA